MPLYVAVLTIVLVLVASGCGSSDTAPEAQEKPASAALGFDVNALASANELASVPLPPLPVGTICGEATVENETGTTKPGKYVGFECDDSEIATDAAATEPVKAQFDKIGLVEFESAEDAKAEFGVEMISQEGRTTKTVTPVSKLPVATICVESQESGDEPYQRCAFLAGRFVAKSLGNEGEKTGAEAGIRVIFNWIKSAGNPSVQGG